VGQDLFEGIATALAIASFIYGLAGVLVLLDDDNPGKWVRILIWVSLSWPMLWAIFETVRRATME
jgi:predicted membrane channel-forming protein YqfA (hemolysin III family)